MKESEETSRRGKVSCPRNRHIITGMWNKLIGSRKQTVRQLSLSLPFDVRLSESHSVRMVTFRSSFLSFLTIIFYITKCYTIPYTGGINVIYGACVRDKEAQFVL